MPQQIPKINSKTDSLFAPLNESRSLQETLRNLTSQETWWNAGSFLELLIIKMIYAAIILLVFWLMSKGANALLKRFFKRTNLNEGVQQLLLKSTKLTFIVFGIVIALGEFLNITPMLAGIGVVGIAVGFAAQDTIQNFISGLTILIDQPFKIGDNITVESTFGTVQEITLRSTRICTVNNEIVVLPNNQMINQKLINHTKLETLRIEIPFSIAYRESVEKAREAALAIVQNDPRIRQEPAPSVIIKKLADSGIDMSFRVWLVKPLEEVPIRDIYIEKLREGLRVANIEIPFPQLTVHLDSEQ